jgi:cytochrome c-type biogenesis protein CcmH
MVLWFILALMTVAAVAAVLWPLSRNRPLRAGSDVAVYRDQLEEIDRDRASGLIGEREAEAARVEVSRRLLAAADAARPATAGEAPGRRRALAFCTLVLLPLGALGLYLTLGMPNLPGQTQQARFDGAAEERSLAEQIEQVETHLRRQPEDGRGWEVIGPVYMRIGRYDDAVTARRHTLRLLGANAEREGDLGESLTFAAHGVVTEEARAAFERSARFNPDDHRTRYFLGLAAEQDGRKQEAAEIWKKLLADAPVDAGWVGMVQESLARVDPGAAVAARRGPSAEDMAAASQLSTEQQNEMARGMVARLAERLKRDGSNIDGWLLLMRSYAVLGDKNQALAAAADARRALADDPVKLRLIDEAAKSLERMQVAAPTPGPSQPASPPQAASPPQPGPSAEDMAAASRLSPAQQNEMVRGMVARLAERLKQDGSDVEGWLRLVRAYVVLGEGDKARAAIGDARRALANDPDKLRRMEGLLKGLEIDG